MLASSCFGGEEPAPTAEDGTPAPAVTATVATEAEPATTATAEPVAEATPTASPAPAAAPVPTLHAAEVAGPLLVLSQFVSATVEPANRTVETRRVILYDIGLDRYWVASEYRDDRSRANRDRPAVQPAGTTLMVWSEGQLSRLALDGAVEAVLLEDAALRDVLVSPDGAKVAVLLDRPGVLLVLDGTSGEERLRVDATHPSLGASSERPLELNGWHADGNAVGVSSGWQRAIVALDGAIRVLPNYPEISPDLRFALRFGTFVRGRNRHEAAWSSIDVLDTTTGRVLWTISDEQGVTRPTEWMDRITTFWLPNSGEPVFHLISTGPVILDTQTGEMRPMTEGTRRRERGRLESSCGADYRDTACDVRYDGRVVWEAAGGWTQYLGLIEVPDDFEVQSVAPVPVAREIAPPPPPARDEIVGPLLAYEVHGDYEYVSDGVGGFRSRPTRRVIVYDEGSERSWSLFNDADEVQLADGGVVLWNNSLVSPRSALSYVTADGRVDALLDWVRPGNFRVSPDGRNVLVQFYGGSTGPARIEVLALPSGDQVLRLETAEIVSAAGFAPATSWGLSLPYAGENGWISDASAVFVGLLDYSEEVYDTDLPQTNLVIALDGSVHVAPCGVEYYGRALSCLSPDGRYTARGRTASSSDYVSENWRSFDIIELATGSVLHSVDGVSIWQSWQREWASPDHFAWPTEVIGSFYFEVLHRDGGAGGVHISVLDVTTGEIDVMDSGDYLGRFYPPPRASTDCPEHPAHPCRILLDGEVVGEGRWPRIIGFIELD